MCDQSVMRSLKYNLRSIAWVALILTAVGLAGCGADSGTTPSAGDIQPPTSSTQPDVSAPAAAPAAWRTDLKVGAQPGDLATNTVVELVDGSTVSLAELADGRPLLLYFFATW